MASTLDTCEAWELSRALYTAHLFASHGRLDDLLKAAGRNIRLEPDSGYEICGTGMSAVFRDSRYYDHSFWSLTERQYRKHSEDRWVLVLRDPLLTRYDSLCRQYERQTRRSKLQDPFARQLESAVHDAMRIATYAYDYRWYDGTMDRKGPRLVVIMFEEFSEERQIAGALFELLDFCQAHLPGLEEAVQAAEWTQEVDQAA